ncbi:MAG: hypothetical protein PHF57_05840 [Methanoregula sp.]|nr:hypothetical protein [Methanoregula sp.]
MDTPDQHSDRKKQVQDLEQNVNDLRQGLATVGDYYTDIARLSRTRDITTEIRQTIGRQEEDADREFDGIWRFHAEMLITDPSARISCTRMYDAFVRYCARTGTPAGDAVEFMFLLSLMENPQPVLDHSGWTGCRLRSG